MAMLDPKVPPSFIVRPATKNDLNGLTELHCAAFQPEDHIPVMLGKEYVRATYRWLVTSSQGYCLVAACDPEIIGLVTVCDRSFTRPMFWACLPEFAWSLLRSPHLIFRKRLWNRLLRRPEMSTIANNIVSQPGFAQLISLVEAAKRYSKSRGSAAIRAGVYKLNQPSRRAFTKNGWIEMPELETNDTIFYVCFLDPEFPARLGFNASQAQYKGI
jgi:hypothetical protein